MNAKDREALRMMFGGKCAYCGTALDGKWHADHKNPINRNWEYVPGQITAAGYSKTRSTGTCRNPENDCKENLIPSCVKCNILKGNADVEGFRQMFSYFGKSIPRIANYSHVHHLMRFGKLTIDSTPVVFWFEQYKTED